MKPRGDNNDGRQSAYPTGDRRLDCLLAGAVGDALGGGVEFWSMSQVRARFGEGELVRDYVPAYGPRGATTDDTQMTL